MAAQGSHNTKNGDVLAKESSIGEFTSSEVAQESSIDEFAAPEARFECPICLAWLRDPVVTSCGHRFCKNCIQEWLEKENACPVDNMKLNKDKDIFLDNFTRREISQQRTKCPNIVRGCLVELSPLDVEVHLLVCEFRPPQLPDHEKLRCSFVNVGCGEKFEDDPELQRHLQENIQQHLVLLSQAYSKVSINQISESASSALAQANYEKLRCSFVNVGCGEKFENDPELQRHLEENIQEHLVLLSQAYSKVSINHISESASSALAQANFWDPPSKQESSSQLGQDENLQNLLRALYEKIIFLEQKAREQDIIISNMSEQISNYSSTVTNFQQRYCNGCFIWHFNDFKNKVRSMKDNPRIMHYSPGFYTSPYGYKLCIRINLSPKDPNYLALLVHVMKSEHDQALDWPFCGRLSISIVHPTQSYRNIKETMMSRPELQAFNRPVHERNPKGFGYTEFALLEELFDQEFITNNRLIVKVNAHPV